VIVAAAQFTNKHSSGFLDAMAWEALRRGCHAGVRRTV